LFESVYLSVYTISGSTPVHGRRAVGDREQPVHVPGPTIARRSRSGGHRIFHGLGPPEVAMRFSAAISDCTSAHASTCATTVPRGLKPSRYTVSKIL